MEATKLYIAAKVNVTKRKKKVKDFQVVQTWTSKKKMFDWKKEQHPQLAKSLKYYTITDKKNGKEIEKFFKHQLTKLDPNRNN